MGALLLESAWLHSRRFAAIGGLVTLGLRSLTYRPGRSILCIALIASATFLIVSLDAFRREHFDGWNRRVSAAGGIGAAADP